jgi:hypothetical protein
MATIRRSIFALLLVSAVVTACGSSADPCAAYTVKDCDADPACRFVFASSGKEECLAKCDSAQTCDGDRKVEFRLAVVAIGGRFALECVCAPEASP